jgi:hypothetical protein
MGNESTSLQKRIASNFKPFVASSGRNFSHGSRKIRGGGKVAAPNRPPL